MVYYHSIFITLAPGANPIKKFYGTSLIFVKRLGAYNGRACFKKVNNCWITNIYSYLKTSGGQSSDLYLNVVHLFNTSVN